MSSTKTPRAAATYRAARRNDRRGFTWRGITPTRVQYHPPVRANERYVITLGKQLDAHKAA
jgi:hypothetical protein